MKKEHLEIGKKFITCTQIFLISIGFILFSVLLEKSINSEAASLDTRNQNLDQGSAAVLNSNDPKLKDVLEKPSSGRTLSRYYSLRQYLGSPPEVPHPVKVHEKELECLICHGDGGWTTNLKRMTPVTPHPEQISCMQCHLWLVTDKLFRAIDWQSSPPPRLGRSYLPGAPPPIPHDLQMRENCDACHVGPGTIPAIRRKHQFRGYCFQCHLQNPPVQPFRR